MLKLWINVLLDEAHYVPGETLRIGGSELKQMTLECIYNPDRGNASWTWTDPTTNLTREDLPKCLSKCKVDPPTRSDLKVEWSGLVSSRPRFHKNPAPKGSNCLQNENGQIYFYSFAHIKCP